MVVVVVVVMVVVVAIVVVVTMVEVMAVVVLMEEGGRGRGERGEGSVRRSVRVSVEEGGRERGRARPCSFIGRITDSHSVELGSTPRHGAFYSFLLSSLPPFLPATPAPFSSPLLSSCLLC